VTPFDGKPRFFVVEHLALLAVQISGVSASVVGLILGGAFAVLQAPIFDSLAIHACALLNIRLRLAAAGFGRRGVV
jgi:hypothetical protein